MFKKGIFLIFCCILLNIGCKYYQTPAGHYTDDYYSDYLPVNAGNGLVTITEIDLQHVNFTFTSPGNPDIQLNNLTFTRQSSIYGTSFEIEYGSYHNYPWLSATFNVEKKYASFSYSDSTGFAPNGFFISF